MTTTSTKTKGATYVKAMHMVGWAVVTLVFAVVLVGNSVSLILDPTKCPVGLVCS